MAGEVTQLGAAGLPTGFFEITDKAGSPDDRNVADTWLPVWTEAPNDEFEIAPFDVWRPVLSMSWSRLRIGPDALDTWTPVWNDVAQPPVIVGLVNVSRVDTWTPVWTESAPTFAVTLDATDTWTPVWTETDPAEVIEIALDRDVEDTWTPVADFAADTPIPSEDQEAKDVTDDWLPVWTETDPAEVDVVLEVVDVEDTWTPVWTEAEPSDVLQAGEDIPVPVEDTWTPVAAFEFSSIVQLEPFETRGVSDAWAPQWTEVPFAVSGGGFGVSFISRTSVDVDAITFTARPYGRITFTLR